MSWKKDNYIFADAENLRRVLIEWFYKHGRDFPWRDKSALDPYKVLVTEILLQKTKAETVGEMWHNFFKVFPTVKELAESTEDHVLEVIQCLGLAYRAKRLIKISRQIVEEYNSVVPSSFDKLLRLHGIGPYVASAVLCFAYGEPQPIVDVNVMRMMNRFKGFIDEKSIREYISKIIPRDHPREFNWALLDVAATICKPDKPNCFACPLDSTCPKINAQMSKWRIMRKNVRGDVKLSLQPYSVRKKTRAKPKY